MPSVAGLGVAPSLEDYEPSVLLYTTPRPYLAISYYTLNVMLGSIVGAFGAVGFKPRGNISKGWLFVVHTDHKISPFFSLCAEMIPVQPQKTLG